MKWGLKMVSMVPRTRVVIYLKDAKVLVRILTHLILIIGRKSKKDTLVTWKYKI